LRNSKRYIGKTTCSFRVRWSKHKWELNKEIHGNQHLQRAWNKYGNDSFIFEVLEECPMEDMDEAEIFWIYTFQTLNRKYGYNLMSGGNKGKFSNEVKQKMCIDRTGTKRVDNTSGYIGVFWDKSRCKWMSVIRINRKSKYIGRFENIVDAAKEHDRHSWAVNHRLDILNFPEDYYNLKELVL
jgi:group I intron endonuclease